MNPHYSLNSTLSSVRKSKSKVLLTTGKSQYKEWENGYKQIAKKSLNQDFYLVVVGKPNLVIKVNFEEWKFLKSRLACSIEAWEVGLLPKTFSLLLRRDRMFSTRSISSFLWVKKPYFFQIFSTLCSVVRQTYVIELWPISILDSSYLDNLCLMKQ